MLALHLESDGGTINGKTLAWLESLRAGLGAVGAAEIHSVPFQRMNVRFHAVGDRGWYVGETDEWGTIPILTARVFGVDVPLLRACARPFGTSGLWPALSEGLGFGVVCPSVCPSDWDKRKTPDVNRWKSTTYDGRLSKQRRGQDSNLRRGMTPSPI